MQFHTHFFETRIREVVRSTTARSSPEIPTEPFKKQNLRGYSSAKQSQGLAEQETSRQNPDRCRSISARRAFVSGAFSTPARREFRTALLELGCSFAIEIDASPCRRKLALARAGSDFGPRPQQFSNAPSLRRTPARAMRRIPLKYLRNLPDTLIHQVGLERLQPFGNLLQSRVATFVDP
jgi:hypothetical protein